MTMKLLIWGPTLKDICNTGSLNLHFKFVGISKRQWGCGDGVVILEI